MAICALNFRGTVYCGIGGILGGISTIFSKIQFLYIFKANLYSF